MDNQSLIALIVSIVASVGGVGVIIVGVAAWFGKIWADTINVRTSARYEKELEDLKNHYNAELEHIKAEFAQRQNFIDISLNTLSQSYSFSRERTLNSIEAIWNEIIQLRSFASKQLFLYSILLPQEYENADLDKISPVLPTISQTDFADHPLHNSEIESKRPFMGEKLWTLYSIYRGFIFRMTWKTVYGRDKGNIYKWDKDMEGKQDTSLINALKNIFTDDELRQIIGADNIGVPERIMTAIEVKILAEINDLIFGRKFFSISIEEQQRLSDFLNGVGLKK
ncbi:MAG: hypothetical protein ABI690_06825 [Chloroflexota bacterium]